MKIITGGRRSGKTTMLIKEAHKTHSRIICANVTRCKHILEMAEKLKINILPPITIRQYFEAPARFRQTDLAFDEVFDCFYQMLPRGNFVLANFTIENEQV